MRGDADASPQPGIGGLPGNCPLVWLGAGARAAAASAKLVRRPDASSSAHGRRNAAGSSAGQSTPFSASASAGAGAASPGSGGFATAAERDAIAAEQNAAAHGGLAWASGRTPPTLPGHVHVVPVTSTTRRSLSGEGEDLEPIARCFVSREATARLAAWAPPSEEGAGIAVGRRAAAPGSGAGLASRAAAPRPPPTTHPLSTAAAGGSLPLIAAGFDKKHPVDEFVTDASTSAVVAVDLALGSGASGDEWPGAADDLGMWLADEPSTEALAAGRIIGSELAPGSLAGGGGPPPPDAGGRWRGWVDAHREGALLPVALPCPLPWLTRRARAGRVRITAQPLVLAASEVLAASTRRLVSRLRWVFASSVAPDGELVRVLDGGTGLGAASASEPTTLRLQDDAAKELAAAGLSGHGAGAGGGFASAEEGDEEESAGLDMGWDGILRGAPGQADPGPGLAGDAVQWGGVPLGGVRDATPGVAAITGAGSPVHAGDEDFDACLAELRESAGLAADGPGSSKVFGLGGPAVGGSAARARGASGNSALGASGLSGLPSRLQQMADARRQSKRLRRGGAGLRLQPIHLDITDGAKDTPTGTPSPSGQRSPRNSPSHSPRVTNIVAGLSLRRLNPTRSVLHLSTPVAEPGTPRTPAGQGAEFWGDAAGAATTPFATMGFDPAVAARRATASMSWTRTMVPASAASEQRGLGIGGGHNGAEDADDPTADLGGVRNDPLVIPALVPAAWAGSDASVPEGGGASAGAAESDVVAASSAAAVLFAALMDSLSPSLSAVGGAACAQQVLVDYVELKRKLVQFTRTTMRQDIIRQNRELRAQGLEPMPIDADAIEAQLPKRVHPLVRRLARQVAAMQRIAGEAVRLHRRLCRLEGTIVDQSAEAALAEALAALPPGTDESAVVTAAGFRSGLLTREQRRVLLADATARLQAHAVQAAPTEVPSAQAAW
ncbi:hypothetical protein FNF29_01379 [Cafeteria roenbergensis]|uniref:Uncharacterized protein n=1 Tax=Cafeteria roenbergensis TaxID=33653 RepID=A0A5A8CUW7_CAFRO|nr:hypothetical protein FNF29_01379 [Cafeteria roenbergensis]KAA0171831.1 hypothetical protein FNF28_00467 [Cafeteria roenbergensis]|eukprot:KAA0155960.1 hypothetical protein FNF29_01379 [Cafeteria roenbergensis]